MLGETYCAKASTIVNRVKCKMLYVKTEYPIVIKTAFTFGLRIIHIKIEIPIPKMNPYETAVVISYQTNQSIN